MTPIDLVCAIVTVALLCCTIAVRPKHAQCPVAWFVNGVHPDGVFECRPSPTGDPDLDGTHGVQDATVDHPGWLRSRIWCTSGQRPIVLEARTVGCQR